MSSDTPERREPARPVADAETARIDPTYPDASRSDAASMAASEERAHALHHDVLQREKERFGGFKFGSAFFGWLTAMGTAVLLTAVVAAIGAALGYNAEGSVDDAADAAAENPAALGIVGAIVIGLVLFTAYFAGGYVAGRMARFSGAKQGIAVWIWAIVIAALVAVVTAIAGSQWDILGTLNGFPRIPVTPETATTAGILTAVGAAIVTLAGAVLGGMAGMRYHRKVDRVGLGR